MYCICTSIVTKFRLQYIIQQLTFDILCYGLSRQRGRTLLVLVGFIIRLLLDFQFAVDGASVTLGDSASIGIGIVVDAILNVVRSKAFQLTQSHTLGFVHNFDCNLILDFCFHIV